MLTISPSSIYSQTPHAAQEIRRLQKYHCHRLRHTPRGHIASPASWRSLAARKTGGRVRGLATHLQRYLNEHLDFLKLEVKNGTYRVAPSKLGLLSLQDITRFAEIAGLEGLHPRLDQKLIHSWLHTSYQNALLVRGPNYEDLGGHEDTFHALQQAVDMQCTLSFRYHKADGTKIVDHLKPYQLINQDGIWYLAAVDQDKLKCYTLTKIEAPFANTDEPFEQDPTIVKTLEEEDSIWLNLSKTEGGSKVAA